MSPLTSLFLKYWNAPPDDRNYDLFKEGIKLIERRLKPVISRYFRKEPDIKDVLQKVFEKIAEHLAKGRKIRSIEAFSREVAINTCLNIKRGQKRKPEDLYSMGELEVVAEQGALRRPYPPSPDEVAGLKDLLRAVGELLSKRCRMLFTLVYLGFNSDEISGLTRLKPGSVQSSLTRCRKNAKTAYKKFSRIKSEADL